MAYDTTSPAPDAAAAVPVMYCANHPDTETLLRCNKCNKPICLKCAVQTPVGYRCKECVREQQDVYYNGTTSDNLIAVRVDEGVGAGLVLDGRLFTGATNAAGEIGHVVVAPGGARCACGKQGCLETEVSEPLVVDWLERLARRYPPAAGVGVQRAWAGLYDMTPDAHPILGAVGDGVYAACGFSGHGFMQSPAVGRALAEEILHGTSELDLSPFRLERFAGEAVFPETLVL